MYNVTDQNFEQEVIKADIPVLVDFWASWCGPCRMLGPILEELAKDMEGKIKVAKINIDENQAIPSSFGVLSIPTMMIFKNGKVISTQVGLLPKDSLENWINSTLFTS